MRKEKQIEEMAADIRLNMQIQPNSREHPSRQLARLLFQDGYRKQSRANWESDDAFLRYRRHYRCSACGYYVERMQNFCPNCGAHMRGDNSEKE